MSASVTGSSATVREEKELVLHGIGVSPGIVVGHVFLIGIEPDHVSEREIPENGIRHEISRVEDALIETRGQIREIQRNLQAQTEPGKVTILDAHLMVLDDRTFIGDVLEEIRLKRRNAEAVFWSVANKYVAVLSKVEDDYIRERVADVKDVTRRIVQNLLGKKVGRLKALASRSIVVANDLAPSETASLPKDLVLGFATDLGSPTSHSAIMARAMGIPAVVGMHDITGRVSTGQRVLIDGNKGVFIVNPTDERIESCGRIMAERRHIESGLTDLRNVPAETKGGGRVVLSANIEMPGEVESVLRYGADGVGLFRSEYDYMSRSELPSEASLAESYRTVAERLDPARVIIRTIDIGGDKLATCLGLPMEANPFFGLRSIRLALAEPEIFKTQLRAILRASGRRNVKIMYPMITSVEEVAQANELLAAAKEDLRKEQTFFDPDIEVGVMIETPSAALTADLIAPMVKFFSLGTNDLIQYAMAVDRVNERVAYLYQPTHPAILLLIKATIDSGHRHGIWVGICGEMASDPMIAPLLVGMGIDEISVAPASVPLVKDAIRSVSLLEAKDLAVRAMKARSAAAVLDMCRELIGSHAPEILELIG